MSRVPRVITNPRDPVSVVEHLYRVQRVVDGLIEFGSPQDPTDPQSATRADGVSHNGTLVNLDGSWYTAEIDAVGRTDITCVHNLGVQAGTGLIPVRWLPFGWTHDGTGGGAATELDLAVWYMGGAVTTNSIVLAVSANVTVGALTISAVHPLRLDLLFTRAVR